jgi:hypothetical protein
VTDPRERAGFRFFRLNKAQMNQIVKFCAKADVRPARGSSEHYVVSWWLQETEEYGWLTNFLAEANLCDEDYGLFVSLRTGSDTGIVRIPQFALALSRRVGGVIDFSYTCIGEE